MKRILAAILLVVLVFSSVIVLSSCGAKPKLNLEVAKENLEEEGYSVSYDDDSSTLGVKETLSARESNGENEINVVVCTTVKYAKLKYEELKMQLNNSKENYKLQIKTLKYKLRAFSKDLSSSEKEAYEESIERYEENLKEMNDIVIGRSGKTVWYGTKDAIKATKG